MDPIQLSLVAQYDDLVRFCEKLIDGDLIEEKVKTLLENCEKQRAQWLIERSELNELRAKHNKASNKIKSLETTLKNVRAAFEKEVGLRNKIQIERDDLVRKLNQVKEYLSDEDKNKTIISSLNLNRLTKVVEEDTSDKSLSDIDYSKSEDNILLDDFMMETEVVPNKKNGK